MGEEKCSNFTDEETKARAGDILNTTQSEAELRLKSRTPFLARKSDNQGRPQLLHSRETQCKTKMQSLLLKNY